MPGRRVVPVMVLVAFAVGCSAFGVGGVAVMLFRESRPAHDAVVVSVSSTTAGPASRVDVATTSPVVPPKVGETLSAAEAVLRWVPSAPAERPGTAVAAALRIVETAGNAGTWDKAEYERFLDGALAPNASKLKERLLASLTKTQVDYARQLEGQTTAPFFMVVTRAFAYWVVKESPSAATVKVFSAALDVEPGVRDLPETIWGLIEVELVRDSDGWKVSGLDAEAVAGPGQSAEFVPTDFDELEALIGSATPVNGVPR